MRKFGLLVLVAAVAFSFSRPADAARLDLIFDFVDANTYNVSAVADTDWSQVRYHAEGVDTLTNVPSGHSPLTFPSEAPVNPSLIVDYTPFTASGDPNSDFAPAGVTIDLGTVLINPGAVANRDCFGLASPPLCLSGPTTFLIGPGTSPVLFGAAAQNTLGSSDAASVALRAGGGAFDEVFVTINNPVPEPGTMVMLGAGLAAVAFLRRKAKQS